MRSAPLAARPAIARRAAVAGEALARERLVHHAVAGRPLRSRPISVPHIGMPEMKALRAVDGVEHPDELGVRALVSIFLADDAVLGERGTDHLRIVASAALSASVTGSNAAAAGFVLDAESRAERTAWIASPETSARRSTNTQEIQKVSWSYPAQIPTALDLVQADRLLTLIEGAQISVEGFRAIS